MKGIKPSGRKYLFEKLINFETVDLLNAPGADPSITLQYNAQPKILISIFDTAYTEMNSDSEARKELYALGKEHAKFIKKFLESSYKEAKKLIDNAGTKFEFCKGEPEFISGIFHLTSVFAADKNFADILELDNHRDYFRQLFAKITNTEAVFYKKTSKYRQSDGIERNSNAPNITFDDLQVVTNHFMICSNSLKLIMLRLDRHYRPKKLMSITDINAFHKIIENSALATKEFHNLVHIDSGRFTAHHRACLSFIEEDNLRKKHPGEGNKDWNHIKAKTHFYSAKGWHLVGDTAEISITDKKEKISQHIALADKYCKNKNSKLFQKLESYKENMSDCKCFVCSKTPTDKARSLCSRCKGIRYCGRECQLKDWPRHKSECRKLGK